MSHPCLYERKSCPALMVIQICVTIPWTSPGKVESNVQGPLFVSSGVTEKSRIVSTSVHTEYLEPSLCGSGHCYQTCLLLAFETGSHYASWSSLELPQ